MADIPQEVREAPMSDHERFITAVAYDSGYQAGLAAGKRAGMERAAEIADKIIASGWATPENIAQAQFGHATDEEVQRAWDRLKEAMEDG